MRYACLALGLFGALLVAAQDAARATATARAHIDTLTSAAYHGRGYVDGGDAKAAEYLARQFQRLGLRPVKQDWFQPFTFNVNTFVDSVGLSIDGRVLQPGVDYLVHPASGSAEGSAPLMHLVPDDLLTPERRAMTMSVVSGGVACLHLPPTTNKDTLALYASLERDLMQLAPVVKPVHGKLTWGVEREAMNFPLFEVRAEHLTDSSRMVDLHVRNRLVVRHTARNVLGMVKGRSKEWIVVGAHYDHLGRMGPHALFPGANDNASGTAMLLALAERFARKPPRHNVLFVAFAGEEAGLLGSEWCVVDRPIDWKRVKLMVNLDILGTGDEGITVVNATAQPAHYERLVALNTKRGHLPQVKSRGPACNSDHCPFVKRGIPAIYIYTLGGVAHYHDVHDVAATLPLTRFGPLYELLAEFIATLK
jgi:hypothetical protein